MNTELLIKLTEKVSEKVQSQGVPPEFTFLANVRSKLIENFNFAPGFAENVLLAVDMPPVPDELLSDDQLAQLARLASIYAGNINWAYDRLIESGFGSSPDAIANYIGRQFKGKLAA